MKTMKIKDAQKSKILRSKASGTTDVVSGTNYVGFQAFIFQESPKK